MRSSLVDPATLHKRNSAADHQIARFAAYFAISRQLRARWRNSRCEKWNGASPRFVGHGKPPPVKEIARRAPIRMTARSQVVLWSISNTHPGNACTPILLTSPSPLNMMAARLSMLARSRRAADVLTQHSRSFRGRSPLRIEREFTALRRLRVGRPFGRAEVEIIVVPGVQPFAKRGLHRRLIARGREHHHVFSHVRFRVERYARLRGPRTLRPRARSRGRRLCCFRRRAACLPRSGVCCPRVAAWREIAGFFDPLAGGAECSQAARMIRAWWPSPWPFSAPTPRAPVRRLPSAQPWLSSNTRLKFSPPCISTGYFFSVHPHAGAAKLTYNRSYVRPHRVHRPAAATMVGGAAERSISSSDGSASAPRLRAM